MPDSNGTPSNHLICRLPATEREQLLASGQLVVLERKQEIYRQGAAMTHVYFPFSCVISNVVLLESGWEVDAAPVGREGMVGIPVHLCLERSPFRSVVQVPGQAVRLRADDFLQLLDKGKDLDCVIRRYVAYSLRFAYQSEVCNARHSVERRACRWLLMTQDRTGNGELPLTQEFLAEMLGVRRPTLNGIAQTLQSSGAIRYRRGRIQVLDRAQLESCSCECYAVLSNLYEQIMRN